MTDKELHDSIARMLKGNENNFNQMHDAASGIVDLINEFVKEYERRGFCEEPAMFLGLKTFEIMLKQARSEMNSEEQDA